ncbi:hypothetical protein BG57_30635 [Caballeronia grimmiae]|uniref:Uncharacterized protein n=1 Tax=Caballeronia grimmiae TaxID=1071679 RepID=A0A069NK42_9BURK|nr:hypothetical protein BG57_30635 [Caballeronia grimmiae]GGD98192.1 hypothetical protein GCM10010985_61180 [Caballeronia grimmiae]
MIPAAGMQDDVIAALRSKYGNDEYKPSSSKVVMNVRFIEPATHTWHVGKDVVILTEANIAASQQLSVEYFRTFNASEEAERKAWRASHPAAGASSGASAPFKPALDASSL